MEETAPFFEALSHTLEARLAALAADNERLTAEHVLLRHLYERAPLSYQSLDENGCFLSVNKAWIDALGYSREEVIGRNFGDFLHPDWRDHFKGTDFKIQTQTCKAVFEKAIIHHLVKST